MNRIAITALELALAVIDTSSSLDEATQKIQTLIEKYEKEDN